MKLNKKKGFTLIELLAVIVVLAIIALIATPIVMNTIEKSKKGAAIESANNLIKSAEYYILQTKNRYGKVSVLDEKLNYSGNKPDLGEVEINKDGKSRIYTYLNGYCVTKDYENKSPYATKTSKEECNWFATDNYETTEGTTFTLNNQKIKNYLIYGNSTQDTRSGKNLFDYSYLNSTYSINGLTMTSTDDVITINGTLNKQGNLVLSNDFPNKFDTSKTYTLKIHVIGGNAVIGEGTGITFAFALFNSTNTKFVRTDVSSTSLDNIASVTFSGSTFEGDENLHLLFQNWRLESTYNNYQVKIQIEEGSTATEYEEYGMMPSPEFPSEINNTGDLITKDNCASYGNDACNNIGKYVVQVKATGKNILDISKLEAGAYSTGLTQSSNTFSFKRTGTKNTSSIFTKIKLEAGTYTISGNLTQNDGKNGGYGVYDLEKQEYLVNRSSSGIGTSTFTVPESKIYSLGFFCNYNSVEGTQVTYSNIQLEYGSSATTYELYREATTNIYLDEPLRKVGDTVDYIDYANGKVVRNIKSELVANKTWNYRADGDLIYYTDSNIMRSNYANSNYFLSGSQKTGTNPYVLTVNNVFRLYNKNYWSSLDSYKTWLNNHKDLVVEYLLATPTEESISLPQIKTVEGTNYITVNTSTSASNLKITTEK